ncbi:glycosyltransferase family 1 protein [Microbacterium sp. AZCO]|uniref:rhamnosyltransferase WsaF family glycosyltransferase n=1 Tax=Microbacterium sp. AZCO TaxID=3142976 RepID=UPI0031F33AA4
MTRFRAAARRALAVGPRGIAQRVAQRAYRATGAADLLFNLDLDDILADVPADLPVPPPAGEGPLTIGWVSTPPAPGSGGHTTVFRMVEALEAAGHTCVLFLYDKHGLDVDRQTAVVRAHWPRVRAAVADARAGIGGVDAVVATGWESAHLVVSRGRGAMHRLYFLQDYEPYFYGHGAEHELAAMTYRFPFRRLALGEMLDAMVRAETGLGSDVVPFGCDATAYRPPEPEMDRSGIVYYSRPEFARRGHQLACVALRRFHALHPEQPIHVYGAYPRGLDLPIVFHGRLTPAELNDLYGRTIAGLALSFTNITLVAEEMLAAGCIPVVNELDAAHLVLANPAVRWAEPTAGALAGALAEVVEEPDLARRARAAAASVVGRSWEPAQRELVRLVEETVRGPRAVQETRAAEEPLRAPRVGERGPRLVAVPVEREEKAS